MADNFNLASARNFLLKESIKPLKENYEGEINEMAKIAGALKDAISAVIKANPDLNGLPLKKAIKADTKVIDALEGEDLYDNQLNKFIALEKGERELGQRGRPAQEKPEGSEKSSSSIQGNDTIDQETEEDEDIAFMDDEAEPDETEIDDSISIDVPTSKGDVTNANKWKDIIVKKVQKLEQLPDGEREKSPDMLALKQFIKKPEVFKTLGAETVRSLVSPIIG